jgi:uncharacterized cupredoxin-like copper-binding protein
MPQARLLVLAPLVMLLAACGSGGNGGTETVRVEGTEYAYVTPASIEGGVVAMEFANTGKELHEFAMGRLAPGKTFEDFRRELEDGGEEGPSSSVDVGGVPLLSPGEEVTITRRLEPGTHVLVCFVPTTGGNTHFDEGMVGSFVVEGDSGAGLPEADGAIVAGEDSYDVPELEAGTKTIELRNDASGPREFNLLRLNPGKTIADAEEWFESGSEGPAPLAFVGAMQSIPAGSSVFLTLDFESGQRYVVFEEEQGYRAELTVK